MDKNECVVMITGRQHEHFIKLVDLFETRQTNAFNFTFVPYGAAFAIFGTFIEKAFAANVPRYDLVVASLLVLAIILPVLVLPLCFLYADVSVFCAALAEGNIARFNHLYKKYFGFVPQYENPGKRAFYWLYDLKPELSIEWVANARVMLFYIAPILGVAACFATCGLMLHRPELYIRQRVEITTALSAVVSIVSLLLTHKACRKTWVARDRAHPSLGPKKASLWVRLWRAL